MPRELVRAPEHDRQKSLGGLAWWWMETFCVHGPGDVQGEPVELDDELAGFILDAYALDEDGRRLYDSAFFSRAKGRAKSELAAFFVLFEAFAPCRFDRWAAGGETYTFKGETYVYEAGEPIGRSVTYPFIRCLATEESQAGNTYDNVYFNLTDGPLAEGLPRDAAGQTRVLLPHGGEIVPSTASSASKDGGKETFAVFDETHLYTLPDLRQMYRTVRRNLGKRKAAQPWSLETSTMYAPGEESVAEKTHELAVHIVEGKTRRSRLLFDHREAPADVDLSNEDEVKAALREVYGPFAEVMDLQRILDEIYDVRNPVSDSRRYFFNQRTSAEDAWLSHPELAAIADATKAIHDRDTVVLGFDGSRGSSRDVADSTVLVGIRLADAHLFEVRAWEEPPGIAGKAWEVPELEVDAEVDGTFRRLNVVGFYADPAGWSEPIARWSAKHGPKLKVKRTANDPIRWKTNQHTLWAETLKSFHDAIVQGKVTFDGSSVLTRHFLNARRRPTRSGMTISKEHPDSPNKVDGAVAATYAWAAYLDAVAAGLKTQRRKAVPKRIM
jgi:hypothetical protein